MVSDPPGSRSNIPMWIMAGALVLIAATLLLVVSCAGYFFIYVPYQTKENERREIERAYKNAPPMTAPRR